MFLELAPLPDGTIDAGDRAQIAGFYRAYFEETVAATVVYLIGLGIGAGVIGDG